MTPDGSEVTQLTRNNFADGAPQFSPDGTQIVYMTTQRGSWEIALMSYPEGDVLAFFDCPDVDCRFPVWSPDGSEIAFNTRDNQGNITGVWLLNVGSGESSLLISGGQHGRPVFSGDGLSIYYNTSIEGITDLYRFDLTTGESQQMTDTEDDAYAPDWGEG